MDGMELERRPAGERPQLRKKRVPGGSRWNVGCHAMAFGVGYAGLLHLQRERCQTQACAHAGSGVRGGCRSRAAWTADARAYLPACGRARQYQLRPHVLRQERPCERTKSILSVSFAASRSNASSAWRDEDAYEKVAASVKRRILRENANKPNIKEVFGRRTEMEAAAETYSAERTPRRSVSEETRRKISEKMKGRTLTEEHRRKIAEKFRGKKNHRYGKTVSHETRRKISESKKGVKLGSRRTEATDSSTGNDMLGQDFLSNDAEAAKLLTPTASSSTDRKSGNTGTSSSSRAGSKSRGRTSASSGSDSRMSSSSSSASSSRAPQPSGRELINRMDIEAEHDRFMEQVRQRIEVPVAVVKAEQKVAKARETMRTRREQQKLRSCDKCKGEGLCPCDSCVQRSGLANLNCDVCLGLGRVFCVDCDGAGKIMVPTSSS
ncbi:hypothetical protein FVE85_0657 [Porphyridium purpureum]|uniref:Nuclease associated modular domain-containing protein n=1 Tax=Porphyridium purpureum TaxID=35688 RepID=A0A5J4Z0S6_PORPP|nr:hypothetical protein FVE85_0657 [Porphyridium purpureum]|eukprot:POR6265..scf208_2